VALPIYWKNIYTLSLKMWHIRFFSDKNKENKDYKDVDARLILGKDISSAFGAQAVKKWLTENGIVAPPPQQKGGCGV